MNATAQNCGVPRETRIVRNRNQFFIHPPDTLPSSARDKRIDRFTAKRWQPVSRPLWFRQTADSYKVAPSVLAIRNGSCAMRGHILGHPPFEPRSGVAWQLGGIILFFPVPMIPRVLV